MRVIAEDNMEDCKTANQISLKIPQMLAVSLTVDCSFFVSAFSSLWFDQVITLQPIYLWLRKRPESFTADRLCSHKSFQRKSGVGWKQFQRETTKTGNI